MSQKNSTINFVIHDANGQPRMVKVVQNQQALSQVKLKQNPLKIIKLPAASAVAEVVALPVNKVSSYQNITPKTEPVEIEFEELTDLEVLESAQSEAAPPPAPAAPPPATSPAPAHAMSYTSRRRPADNDQPEAYTTKRRKHADKVGKGLRHFSMKVCEKVRTKGFTSYNEVADELVAEYAAGIHGSADSQQYDQKNIRRRVYDALNVLMAMNIISKEKKEIRWLGLPTNSIQECTTLEKEKQFKLDRIQKKTQQLQELILQHISFKSLIERNKDSENKGLKPSPSSAIHLPFIVVNTSDKALIDCSISNDKTEYMFNFNRKFQIHDDIDILKRMGLLFGLDKGECSEEDIERAKSMVPNSLEQYVERMGRGISENVTDILEECDDDEADAEPEDEDEADGDAGGEEDAEGEGEDTDSGSDVAV